MDHLEVLREKIARLRSEIADIQELNDQYRFRGQKRAETDIARSHRQERLQEIQEELVRLSQLGHKALSIELMREKHRSRLNLVKNASYSLRSLVAQFRSFRHDECNGDFSTTIPFVRL